jgi:hypothetical protein
LRIQTSRLAPPARPALQSLEPRRLLAAVADVDLFGPAPAVHASGTDASAAFAPANALDGTSAAFRFANASAPQRLAVSNLNAAVHTLRFFDTPSYADRAAPSVTVYYSPLKQLALTPASYARLGTFTLPTANVGGAAPADVYLTPTSPADHPRASEPGAVPAATVRWSQLTGLTIPPGTQSLLLDFGINSAGLGFGFSEIQALGYPSTARPADPTLLAWGQNVYQKTNASLKVPGSNLYSETASTTGTRSGGDSGFAFVWPQATQFRVLTDLVKVNPATYTSALRAFSDELHARYWRTTSPGGYRSGVSSGATLYYDDNGHIAVALAEAYHLTGDPAYLARAIQTYDFVLSGEDAAGGGGIYFSVPDKSSKDAISTLQAVRAGLVLYQITGQSRFLADATRLYAWSVGHIQQPSGLFRERFKLTGANAGSSEGATLVNSAGIGVAANLLFYNTTGDLARLREAQRIAAASRSAYFNASTGAINDEGYWAFELVDALGDLYLTDRNPVWLTAATNALTWLRNNREDPNGRYGRLWAREAYTPGTVRPTWGLIDQASVARAYLHTAAIKTVAPSFATAPGDAIVAVHQATVGGNHVPSTVGGGAGQYLANESPANVVDNAPGTKHLNFGNGNGGVSSPTKGVGTGFYVTPALGPSIVTGVQLATANDSPNRDPLTVSIEGTNATGNYNAGATWTLIADNVDLGIATDPGRQTYGPIVRFLNTTAYRSYRVIIKSQRGSDIGVQYAELNLVGREALPPRVLVSRFGSVTDQAVVVQFSEDVGASLTPADLVVQSPPGGPAIPASAMAVAWDADSHTARWTFPGHPAGLPDGRYRATLAATSASNRSGSPLAAATTVDFGVLAGDATGDGRVDFADLVRLAQSYDTTGRTYQDGDFNFDRSVDFADLVLLAQRYDTALPGALVSTSAKPAESFTAAFARAELVSPRTSTPPEPGATKPVTPAPQAVVRARRPVAKPAATPTIAHPPSPFAARKIQAPRDLAALLA